jgi:hypothetical protein
MLVNILQTFDAGNRRYYVGENPDVHEALARKWIADGLASADVDGRADSLLANSGVRQNNQRIGQVATACLLANWTNTTNKQMMNRSLHKARENIKSLQIGVANWYCALQVSPNNGSEANFGTATSVTASIEYPVGTTVTQVTFNGSTTGSIAAGTTLISDAVAVNIPNGASFYVRLWTSNPTGMMYSQNHVAQTGEMNAFGVTTPDLTGVTTSFGAAGVIMQTPVCIIGASTQQSYFLAGDSRNQGIADVGDVTGNVGELSRSVGNKYAYINAGIATDRVNFAAANYARRLELAQYCTHVLSNYGINDNLSTAGNRTGAQVLADLITFAALFTASGKSFYQATIPPRTSSTDSFATTVNQSTAVNTNHAQLVVLNDSIRGGGVTGASGYLDIANAVCPTGVWDPLTTTDGLHANLRGNLQSQMRGAIIPAQMADA